MAKTTIGNAAAEALKERRAKEKEAGALEFIVGKQTFEVELPIPADSVIRFARAESNGSVDDIIDAFVGMIVEKQRPAFREALLAETDIDYVMDLFKEVNEAVSSRPTNK